MSMVHFVIIGFAVNLICNNKLIKTRSRQIYKLKKFYNNKKSELYEGQKIYIENKKEFKHNI